LDTPSARHIGHGPALPRTLHAAILIRSRGADRFFQDYKNLEGKAVEVYEIESAREAYRVIDAAIRQYKKKKKK